MPDSAHYCDKPRVPTRVHWSQGFTTRPMDTEGKGRQPHPPNCSTGKTATANALPNRKSLRRKGPSQHEVVTELFSREPRLEGAQNKFGRGSGNNTHSRKRSAEKQRYGQKRATKTSTWKEDTRLVELPCRAGTLRPARPPVTINLAQAFTAMPH